MLGIITKVIVFLVSINAHAISIEDGDVPVLTVGMSESCRHDFEDFLSDGDYEDLKDQKMKAVLKNCLSTSYYDTSSKQSKLVFKFSKTSDTEL